MIKAKFEHSSDGNTLILSVSGHAGSAEKGKDLICASVSILTYTIAQIVQSFYDEKKLKKQPTIKLDDGNAVITCKPRKDIYKEALYAYIIIMTGFKILQYNYPEYVQLKPFDESF
ncbi:MAG: ribosomal-processing cysteine protease Prp [Candidatus Fimenecus sp.]